MGFMDKARKLIGGHESTVEKGIGKAGDLVDKKLGGQHSAQVQEAEQKLDEEVQNVNTEGGQTS